MCGIWASVGLRADRSVIDAVRHRGPDGEGWREFHSAAGPVMLGHRRLAVIDTSETGHQPMSALDGAVWAVFNGMIYNYVELRDELIKLGYRFRGASDTEVLLNAWRAWGPASLDRLNGMFAFVIWDDGRKIMFAARDRFGIKPLYFWRTATGVAFASEIKQFRAVAGFRARLHEPAARDFLRHGLFDHSDATLFQGVRQLAAGHAVQLDTSSLKPGDGINVFAWYARPAAGGTSIGADEAASLLRQHLERSVALRLRADVPIGFCLSGGLDSSALVCLAGNAGPRVTVSACYNDKAVDERPFIAAVIALTGASPVHVFPQADGLAAELDRLLSHQEVPLPSTSAFAQWCVFRAAREAGLTVMLDGQGSDELLAGYHSAFAPYHAGLLRAGSLGRVLAEWRGARRRHGTPALAHVARVAAHLMPGGARRRLRALRSGGTAPWLRDSHVPADPLPEARDLNELATSHLWRTSLPMLLHLEDRNSMAHGIESRLPFLDFQLVEFLVGLGDAHKIVDGETKWLLRRALRDVLPAAVRDRQDKIGFATPEAGWLKGALRPVVSAGLTEAADRFPTLLSVPRVRAMAHAITQGTEAPDAAAWRLSSFGHWGRVFDVAA